MQGMINVGLIFAVITFSAEGKHTSAELRRWDGSSNCSGSFTVLNSDKMGECTPYVIPAPASVLVDYVNETTYSSYHYQGVTDCSGNQSKHSADWVVGECEDLGGFSQMRVWIDTPEPPPATCGVPGKCGRAYQACCLASKLKGEPCKCKLQNGSGEAGSKDCGFCGRSFVTCCSGFKVTGSPCACDVAHHGEDGAAADAAAPFASVLV